MNFHAKEQNQFRDMLNNRPRIIPGHPIDDASLCKNIESRREMVVLSSETSQFSDFPNDMGAHYPCLTVSLHQNLYLLRDCLLSSFQINRYLLKSWDVCGAGVRTVWHAGVCNDWFRGPGGIPGETRGNHWRVCRCAPTPVPPLPWHPSHLLPVAVLGLLVGWKKQVTWSGPLSALSLGSYHPSLPSCPHSDLLKS